MEAGQRSPGDGGPAPWVALLFSLLGFAFVLAAVGAVIYGRKAQLSHPSSAAARFAVILGWVGVAWNAVGLAVLAWRLGGA